MKNRFKYLFIIFLSLSFFINAQTDSLKILDWCKKAHDFEQSNIDSAIYYGTEALKLARQTKSAYLKAAAALQYGAALYNIADYKKATAIYKEGILFAESSGNLKLQAQAYNGFANLFANQRQFKQASEYFHKALEISKKIGDKRKISVVSMNLANIEYNESYYSGDFTKTNAAYKEAYDWAVAAQDTSQQITCLGNWGMSYSDEGKFPLSLNKLDEAIKLATIAKHDADLVFLLYYKGRTYGLMREHKKALETYLKSLELAKKFNDADFESENYLGIAESNYELGNYKQAFEDFRTYKSLEDSITNKEITNELNSIKTKYDTEKKQKEIELLKVNANKDKIVKYSLLTGAVFLLVLAFLLFNRYRLKERNNKLLEHQNHIISEKNKDISDSINYAKKIQEAIFPQQDDIEKIFPNSFVLSIPKDIVSGDFYWCFTADNLKLFVVADCTGHGVPGAFMSMIGNTLLNNIVAERKILRPDLILNELRKEIIKALKQGEDSSSKDGMDLSLICLDITTNKLEIACANNPVWIIKRDGSLLEVKPDKQPIGYASQEAKDFSLNMMQLQEGDIIYQFSDGYADQFGGEKGKKFKYNQLKELLHQISQNDVQTQRTILKSKFEEWKGNLVQIDDVLVSGIRV